MAAIVPAEPGTVSLMNLNADSNATHGSRGSGVTTAPRSEIASGMNPTCASNRPVTSQAGSAWLRLSAIVPKPMSASWLISR
jgi:hypothetical protein